jgi:hypothetical protein
MAVSSDESRRPALDAFAFWLIPLCVLSFQLLTHVGYGYFRDELYYLANGHHLGWGYVEHPPLIGLIAALVERALGTSLFALRLLPAVAHAATVALTAAIAREMGGGRRAQVIGALAAFACPAMVGLFAVFTMNAFDLLCWAVLSWIVARYLRTGNERLWLLFGLVAGVGLENKISVLFLGFGVACGLLVAGPRTAFRRAWIWVGGAIAAALFLPHVAWQAANGWPTLEFIHNATTEKNVSLSPLAFLAVVAVNTVAALPVWIAGLLFLLAAPASRRWRSLGWAFLAVLAVMLVTNSKPYYLTPAFTVLFAAGGVGLERLAWGWRRADAVPADGKAAAVARGLALAWLLVTGVLVAPFAKPLLSEDAFVAYAGRLGMRPPQEERNAQGRLPQQYADMHGWHKMAADIGEVYRRLPAADREKACVLMTNYGEAGAIDLFGPAYHLPPALAGHNSYFLWGPRGCTGDVVIVFGRTEEGLRKWFASVERASTFTCTDCMPYESDRPIWIARGLKTPVAEWWAALKRYI